jgi:hypothetical protein
LVTGSPKVLSRELINEDGAPGFNVATNVTHEIEKLVNISNVDFFKKYVIAS